MHSSVSNRRDNCVRIGFNARVLADSEVRGLSRYTVCLLKALSSLRGVELILFCKEQPASNHLADINARIVTFDAPREMLWNDVLLPRALKREGIDIFHAPADRGLGGVCRYEARLQSMHSRLL